MKLFSRSTHSKADAGGSKCITGTLARPDMTFDELFHAMFSREIAPEVREAYRKGRIADIRAARGFWQPCEAMGGVPEE